MNYPDLNDFLETSRHIYQHNNRPMSYISAPIFKIIGNYVTILSKDHMKDLLKNTIGILKNEYKNAVCLAICGTSSGGYYWSRLYWNADTVWNIKTGDTDIIKFT